MINQTIGLVFGALALVGSTTTPHSCDGQVCQESHYDSNDGFNNLTPSCSVTNVMMTITATSPPCPHSDLGHNCEPTGKCTFSATVTADAANGVNVRDEIRTGSIDQQGNPVGPFGKETPTKYQQHGGGQFSASKDFKVACGKFKKWRVSFYCGASSESPGTPANPSPNLAAVSVAFMSCSTCN